MDNQFSFNPQNNAGVQQNSNLNVQQNTNTAPQGNPNPYQQGTNTAPQGNANVYQQGTYTAGYGYGNGYQQNGAQGYVNQPYRQYGNVPSYTPVNNNQIYNCGQVRSVAPNPQVNQGQPYRPQYHHGAAYYPVFNQQYYDEKRRLADAKKAAEKKIRSISTLAGGNLLFSFLVSNIFSFVFMIPFISDLYDSGVGGSSFINIIYSVVTVLGGFLIYDFFFKNHAKQQVKNTGGVDCYSFKISFGAPKGFTKTLLLIFIGFGGCMLSNYLSSFLLTFIESFGVSSTYSAIENPKTIQDIILMCIGTAIIPPLTEELAVRGLLMSRLRRYGNWFAIVASAFIFGMFHGTFAQIPFAFGCGLFIGYAVIATGSIWTGVIIHFLNNAISCVASVMTEYGYAELANTMFMMVSLGGVLIGLICFIIYFEKYRTDKTLNSKSKFMDFAKSSVSISLSDGVGSYQGDAFELTQGEKLKVFFKNPLVVAGTVLYGLLALLSLELF